MIEADIGIAVERASPFALEDERVYRRWRDAKLAIYPRGFGELVVEVRDPRRLSDAERRKILALCCRANMAICASHCGNPIDASLARDLGVQLGLVRLDANPLAGEDGVSALEVAAEKAARGYVPYSSRRLSWHTDGYYNPPPRRIRAFILHCVRPAAEGGVNRLLDPEIAYILLREADPAHIRALSAPDVLTIPANTEGGVETRPAVAGPVFSIDVGGALHMRYTARTRSIQWRADAATRAAVQCLEDVLAGDSPHVFAHRLAAGEALVCNNILHERSAFTEAPPGAPGRLIYRARYYDRVAGSLSDGRS